MVTFTFTRIPGAERLIRLTPAAMAAAGLPAATETVVSHGARRVQAAVIAASDGEPAIAVTGSVAEALGLVEAVPYRLSLANGELRIGPVIGILVSCATSAIKTKPGSRAYELVLRYAEVGGLVYLFALDGVDLATETIKGYAWMPDMPAPGAEGPGAHWERNERYARGVIARAEEEGTRAPHNWFAAKYRAAREQFFREEAPADGAIACRCDTAPGGFVKGRFPFPAALWLRWELPDTEVAARLRARVGPRIFNSSFFDKEAGHRMLSAFPEVRPYLPDTVPLTRFADLFYRLDRHGRVVLKQQDGKKAQGLIRVELEDEGYLVRAGRAGHGEYFPNRPGVEAWLGPQVTEQRYLVQQYIDLPQYRGRPLDFRVMMQKDGRGQWVVRGALGRFGQTGAVVTNFVESGYALPMDEALRRAFATDWAGAYQLKARITDLAHTVCPALDRAGGCYGDLGLDIAVDREGRPWLFEVNKLPFHGLPLYMGDGQMYLEVKSGPLLFGSFLSGFGQDQKGGR